MMRSILKNLSSIRGWHTLVILLLALSSPALSQKRNLESSLSYSTYSAIEAVRLANQLISVGELEAYAILENMARPKKTLESEFANTQKVIILATLIYRNGASNRLRQPRIGECGVLPYNVLPDEKWQTLPIEFIDDIPLILATDCMLFGQAESAINYLEYCRGQGIFRTHIYWTPSEEDVNTALDKLFLSEKWQEIHWNGANVYGSYEENERDIKNTIRAINTRKHQKQMQ